MRTWSEVGVFVGVVALGIGFGGSLLRQNHQMRLLLARKPKIVTEGTKLDPIRGYRWDNHKVTMVIALRTGCAFCEASMPLYARLANLWVTHQVGVHPLVLYEDSAPKVAPEIQKLQLLTDADFAMIGVSGTPTVLLVEDHGRVLRKWVGRLPPSDEDELLARVSNFAAR